MLHVHIDGPNFTCIEWLKQ